MLKFLREIFSQNGGENLFRIRYISAIHNHGEVSLCIIHRSIRRAGCKRTIKHINDVPTWKLEDRSLVSTWPTNFQPGFPGKMDLSDSIGDIEAEGWQEKTEFEVQKEGTVEIGYRLSIRVKFYSNWKCSYFYPYLLLQNYYRQKT